MAIHAEQKLRGVALRKVGGAREGRLRRTSGKSGLRHG